MTVCLLTGAKALLDAILQVNRKIGSKPGPQNTFIQPTSDDPAHIHCKTNNQKIQGENLLPSA